MNLLDPHVGGSPSPVFDRIRANGCAVVRLDHDGTARLAELHREAMAFFALDVQTRLRYSRPNRTAGYRQHGYAHAGSPDAPDMNDSFLYWMRTRDPIPHSEEITPFLRAFEAYRLVAAAVAHDVIDGMRSYYGYEHELPFEDASVLQINSFGTQTDRDLLQTPHEDAVFLTVIWTSADGLEAVRGGRAEPLKFSAGEVLVMPGGVMTEMTGGEIEPFYHQARNYGYLDRKSVMYFVSPDVDRPIEPFVVNDYNRGLDIRRKIIDNPQTFGLSEDFLSVNP